MINLRPAGQEIAYTCLQGCLCRTWERWCCNNPAFRVFLFPFIFRISWESWERRSISDCVWFRKSPHLFTLRKRSCGSSADTTPLFCGTLRFCAFFHSPLSRGVPEQRRGTAELRKLAGLLSVFLGPKMGGSDSNS